MNSFASTWPSATVAPDGTAESNPPPEPGEYEVSVQNAKAFTSKAGNEVMVIELRDLATGYVWPVLNGFKSDKQTEVAKSFAARLGVSVDEVASLEELDYALKLVIGSYFRVAVVQNGQYLNTYVNERLASVALPSDVPEGDVPTHATDADDTPIPF